jgi:hypothetical protein
VSLNLLVLVSPLSNQETKSSRATRYVSVYLASYRYLFVLNVRRAVVNQVVNIYAEVYCSFDTSPVAVNNVGGIVSIVSSFS